MSCSHYMSCLIHCSITEAVLLTHNAVCARQLDQPLCVCCISCWLHCILHVLHVLHPFLHQHNCHCMKLLRMESAHTAGVWAMAYGHSSGLLP